MPLEPVKASRLIELLARHIAAHGDLPVAIGTKSMDHPVVRCWHDGGTGTIKVSAT